MHIEGVREHLEYPELTMFQMVERMAKEYPNATAYEFFNRKTSYSVFVKKIENAARAFRVMGIETNDRVTICLPNVPQCLDSFYAINRIGAVANMVHPLSAQHEITFYLNVSHSKIIVTMDMFYEKVKAAAMDADHPVRVIVCRMQDELNFVKGAAFTATKGKSFLKFPNDKNDLLYKAFLLTGVPHVQLPEPVFDKNKTAVILYSGGTSGLPKGICLSDLNFNACGMQATEAIQTSLTVGDTMLSCMPCFHGFGLGMNIHAVLINGATCILMPAFNSKSYAKMLAKKQPNYIAGVPTIYEALLHIPELDGVDLSCLKAMFCGGDCLSVELKKKVDQFLKEHNATIQIREGYGLTECVTASCLTPRDIYREGSIGLPFPDTTYCIVRPGTEEEMPAGEEGEIILTTPTLMLGYLDAPEETAKTLRVLPDGRTWLYTGDMGFMDEDGFVYFKSRIKRMFVYKGYNIYPSQLENVIDSCEEVSYSCVIGVPVEGKGSAVKAFVVLKDGVEGTEEIKKNIIAVMKKSVALYALPKEIEFRSELPKTNVGKVSYRTLEAESANGSPLKENIAEESEEAETVLEAEVTENTENTEE